MRIVIALAAFASPATAWEFTAVPVCTISEETTDMRVAVTYDGRKPEPYSITMTGEAWAPGPVFAIQFGAPGGLTISTDRHRLTADGTELSVSDRGFGNVLRGLANENIAYLGLGDTVRTLPLDGAAEAVAAFEACVTAPLS